MNLLDLVSVDDIRSPLAAVDKRGVIDELVDLIHGRGHVSDPEPLKAAVWTREQTRTTGIGHGLAIPHGKCSGLSGLAVAIGKPASPLDFEAIDDKPVQLVVLLASPPDRTSDHIQALAQVSRLFGAEAFRTSVYEAGSAEEIFDLIRGQLQP